MNNQEFFTATVAHLRKQGMKAMENNTCLYRGSDGMQCAVGCHIPAEMYRPEMEGRCCDVLFSEFGKVAQVFDGVNGNLIGAMQEVHDEYPVGRWEEQFDVVAHSFGLNCQAMETT